jgi:ligand-binding sensor domain-containing protein/signal transduction histidine kinase
MCSQSKSKPPTRKLLRRAAAWLLWCCAAACLSAYAEIPRTLHFEQLSVKQGLAQESITAITQDRTGFMWFGSQNGLSRFDGYRFTVFRNIPNDASSLADNWIQCLYVDESNRLWVGTRVGLQLFDPDSESFTTWVKEKKGDPAGRQHDIRGIAPDRKGGLWLATAAGLLHFDPANSKLDVMQHIPGEATSLSADVINAVASDWQGNVWVSTQNSVDYLPAGSRKFHHFLLDGSDTAEKLPYEANHLWSGKSGSVWLGTAFGLEQWRWEKGRLVRQRFGAAEGLSGMVTAFFEDEESRIWVGTNNTGLHYLDNSSRRFVPYRADARDVADKEVSYLFKDRGGTLWIGTWTSGVKHADVVSAGFKRLFHTPGKSNGLSDGRIYSISGDAAGHLWLGTFGGIDLIDYRNGKMSDVRGHPKHDGSLRKNDVVIALRPAREGGMWVGSSAGLKHYDTRTGLFRNITLASGLSNGDSITDIRVDGRGNLWAGSHGGLHKMESSTGRVHTYRHDVSDPSSLADNWVRMVLHDREGTLWVATDNGLDRLRADEAGFTHFRHEPDNPGSLGSNRVQCLFEDSRGRLWVGTNGGLNRMEKDTHGNIRFKVFTVRDGLGADSIGAILEDAQGNLWMSTSAGISRLDARTGKFRNYVAQDGMIEGYYYVGSAFRAEDGTMYFGGKNGLTAFHPDDIRDNPFPPRSTIVDIQVGGRTVRRGSMPEGTTLTDAGGLTLPYGHSLSVSFSALHYADPQRNRFAYRLSGVDKDWIIGDESRRKVNYPNLEPGRYTLRLKASNKDDVWDESGTTLNIFIEPPLWKTWWFRILAAGSLLATTWLLYRMRIRALTQRQRLLEDQVNVRTAELVQQKNIVEQKNDLLEQQTRKLQGTQEELQRYVDDRQRLFVSISHDLRTPITRLKLRSELLDDDELRNEFHEDLDELDMLVKGALQCVKDEDIHENFTEVRLDPLISRMIRGAKLADRQVSYTECGLSVMAKPLALKRAIENLLTNALHYGERAEISVQEDGDCIEIRVRDHGPGVDESMLGALFEPYVRLEHGRAQNNQGLGLGLGIARDIVDMHGGELILRNHPERGLLATIRLPGAPVPVTASGN